MKLFCRAGNVIAMRLRNFIALPRRRGRMALPWKRSSSPKRSSSALRAATTGDAPNRAVSVLHRRSAPIQRSR